VGTGSGFVAGERGSRVRVGRVTGENGTGMTVPFSKKLYPAFARTGLEPDH
jgi:hypothetical protein